MSDSRADKGQPIPVVLSNPTEKTGPIEVNVSRENTNRQVIQQEHISLDKIVGDSGSSFYVTGKNTKINLMNFLTLLEKHELAEVAQLDQEELVVSSDLITRVAMAPVVDEDENDMQYIDAFVIGFFVSGLLISIFLLVIGTLEDMKSLSWILVLVSVLFLGQYLYKGVKSGELNRIIRVVVKSLSKK